MRAGEVYENRVQGDRFVVREGSEDTGGERLTDELYVRPGGRVAGKHTHSYITERFEVRAGTVRFHLDGRERIARPGEQVEVPPGAVHDWWNVDDDEAYVFVDIRPAERFELMVRTSTGWPTTAKPTPPESRSFFRSRCSRASSAARASSSARRESSSARCSPCSRHSLALAATTRSTPEYLGPSGKAAVRPADGGGL